MESSRSLGELFAEARNYVDGADITEWRNGVRFCSDLAAAVDAAQLFSPNESAEEVATTDLKFLLLPFYQATLLTRCDATDPQTKSHFLQAALEHYRTFLSRLWSYELCGTTAK